MQRGAGGVGGFAGGESAHKQKTPGKSGGKLQQHHILRNALNWAQYAVVIAAFARNFVNGETDQCLMLPKRSRPCLAS